MRFEYLNKPFEPAYQSIHLEHYQSCGCCQASTNRACQGCGEPRCFNCLFPFKGMDGKPAAVCLLCHLDAMGEPPAAWYFELSMPYVAVDVPAGSATIRPGVSIPAGDSHSWHRPASAEKILHWFYPTHGQELNVFELVSMAAWISAWSVHLAALANTTGAALLAQDRAEQAAARRADAGIVDWEQFE